MSRSCLLLLAGLGLLGRDGGVDALPAIGCADWGDNNYMLRVPSGSADCAKVASAIGRLPVILLSPARIGCVRRRLRFGLSLARVGKSRIGPNSDDCGACSN